MAGAGTARTSGYSETPLPRKLGLKAGQRVAFIALPEQLAWLANSEAFALRQGYSEWSDISTWHDRLDVVHGFAIARADLEEGLPLCLRVLEPDGTIWVSWPKRASRIATDITENVVRDVALPLGLVDVKVCAVDEVWSGLKLVVRKELRRK